MKKQIHIYYSVRVNLERLIEVDENFKIDERLNLKSVFDQLCKQFPDQDLEDLDNIEIQSNPDVYDHDSFKIDGIEIETIDNRNITSDIIQN